MTPWELIDNELSERKRSWSWLAESLGLSVQSVNHWKARGVPAKYYAEVEDLLKKSRGWLVDGKLTPDDQPRGDQPVTPTAMELAFLFDLIPVADRIRRTQAYNAASKAILDTLELK
jgi:hypothetical protein